MILFGLVALGAAQTLIGFSLRRRGGDHCRITASLTADETTLLWDPEDVTAATFENPLNQPSYSQLCGHHVFLSDGKLLSVGGGGYGPNPAARFGWKFDPIAKSWAQTSTPMSESKPIAPVVASVAFWKRDRTHSPLVRALSRRSATS